MFTTRNLKVSENTFSYTKNKIEKLQKRFKNLQNIHVIFSKERYNKITEIIAHIKHSVLNIKTSSPNLKKSIDLAINKLKLQLKKYKKKIQPHKEDRLKEVGKI